MTHYHTLGISKKADSSEIKAAYRRLASKHHPDRQGGNAEEFKKIREAYEILKDPQKRQEYDNPAPSSIYGFGPLFNDLFRDRYSDAQGGTTLNSDDFMDILRQHHNMNVRNQPSLCEAHISIIDAYHGKQCILTIDNEKPITLNIPPGTRSGTQFRIHGEGIQHNITQPAGDLIVRVIVQNDPKMRVQNNDIYQQLTVNAIDCMIGGSVNFQHISGKQINIKIPKGTQQHAQLKLSKLGMPDPNNNENHGNLYIEVDIQIPKINNDSHIDMLNTIKTESN